MTTMSIHTMIKPTWIRLVDHNNGRERYVGSIDPVRGVLMTVDRGGTATFDLVEIIAEWHRTQITQGEAQGQ